MSEIHQPADRGIAMRIGVSADDGCMIDMTSVVPETYSQGELQQRLEALMGAAKAVRAKHQLPALRAEADETHKFIVENEQRLAEIEAAFAKACEGYQAQEIKGTQLLKDLEDAAQAEWFASGRQGPHEIRGHRKRELTKVKDALGKVMADREKAVEQYQIAHSGPANEIVRKNASLEILRRRIGECERLARGEDISGV